MKRSASPAQILFDDAPPPPALPPCDHYAGTEKLMRKSLSLQQTLGPVFDITLDCEDGAAIGREAEHADLVGELLAGAHSTRVGVRIHDPSHAHWREDLRRILAAGRAPAYVMVPKVRAAHELQQVAETLDALLQARGLSVRVPLHALIETHDGLAAVREIAALPAVESLSFGLMDFVSAHGGAIPEAAMGSPLQFEHPLVVRAKVEIAAACHAFGKVPSHNVCTDVRDAATVRADAQRARAFFGFTRMWSIHPAQIEPILAVFRPSDEEISLATAVMLAAAAADFAPIRHADRLHDRASFRYHWMVLVRARRLGQAVPAEAARLFDSNAVSDA